MLWSTLLLFTCGGPSPTGSADYAGAEWAGPACNASPRVAPVSKVVVHTCEGRFGGCVDWLKGCHRSSAHYVVSSAGRVQQLLPESSVAWHATCLNSTSIGIEHEGFTEDPAKWYGDAMYCASAKLVASICRRHGFPCDRAHVIGHDEANRDYCGGTHNDPGNGWDWTRFMAYVRNGGCEGALAVDLKSPQLTISIRAVPIAGQPRDLDRSGRSAGIFDLLLRQRTRFHVDVSNTGGSAARNVAVGSSAAMPYLRVRRWDIESSRSRRGRRRLFKIGDTDGLQNVSRQFPGPSFSLWLGDVSPGETKRITLLVEALRTSAGSNGHPQLRAWIAHADDLYDKPGYADAPTHHRGWQRQNNGDLKVRFQTDVLSGGQVASAGQRPPLSVCGPVRYPPEWSQSNACRPD